LELCPEIRSQWGLVVEGRGRDQGRYALNQMAATADEAADVRFERDIAFHLRHSNR